MRLMTRRKFLGAGVASAGAVAGLASHPVVAEATVTLDATYQTRDDLPDVTVAYPSAWHLYPKLITDLVVPAELFSISNEVLTPGPSADESGLPDVSPLSDTGVLITILAQRLGTDGRYSPGQPISKGIKVQNLRKSTRGPSVDERTGWFLDTDTGYLVFVWSGKNTADLGTADAILRSFHPS